MIPQFPNFKHLEPPDKPEMDLLTSAFRHYSDHQYASLWAWDLDNTILISRLGESIVFRFRDYLNGELFYSFVGTEQIEDTAKQLIGYSASQGLEPKLRLIPEEMAKVLAGNEGFKVTEDRDNFDYVVDIERALEWDIRVKARRKLINRFDRLYPNHEIQTLNLSQPENRQLIVDAAKRWTSDKDNNPDRINNEIPAMARLINAYREVELLVLAVFNEGDLAGFSIEEILDEDYAAGHFQRADYKYNCAFAFLDHTVTDNLNNLGLKYVNAQQDLGDAKLRETKQKNDTTFFLKKYSVSL